MEGGTGMVDLVEDFVGWKAKSGVFSGRLTVFLG
jgi:hypothetical protein